MPFDVPDVLEPFTPDTRPDPIGGKLWFAKYLGIDPHDLLHNIVLVTNPVSTWYPVPYDFDYSGLVDARYAIPARQFNLTSVRDRLYLGPCRSAAELEPFFQKIHTARPQILALFDTIPHLDDNDRRSSKKYLEKFFETISKPGDVKRAFIDGCNGRPGM